MKRSPVLLIALVLVAVLGGAGLAFRTTLEKRYRTWKIQREWEELQRRDEEVLRDDRSPPQALYAALVRKGGMDRARASDPARLIQFARATDPLVRAGAAIALGCHQSPEAEAALKTLMSDPEVRVRSHAIRGVSCVSDPARLKWIQEFVAQSGLSDELRVEALSALWRVDTSAQSRAAVVDKLIALAEKAGANEVGLRALGELSAAAPRDARVHALLLKGLQDPKLTRMHPTAIRILALARHPGLMDRIVSLWKSTDPGIRLALVDAIHLGCPDERWKLLDQWLAEEKVPMVRRAILRSPGQMPGAEALAALARWKESGRISDPAERSELSSAESQAGRSGAIDACIQRRKVQPTVPAPGAASGSAPKNH